MAFESLSINKLNKEIMALFNQVSIVRVVLDEQFAISPYLYWFDRADQKRIISYYHYKDKLTAFTSYLLQKYYLPYFTHCERTELIIAYTGHHKPYIAKPDHIAREFNFNITHSHNHVVLAIYQGVDYTVGVDIEQIDYSLNISEMAPLVFSESERELINSSCINFFKLWTKKEALIKALGTGFATDFYQDTALSLEDVEVTNKYCIITSCLGNYFLSICLHKVLI